MVCIRDARAEDFEKVYPLLLEFNNDHLTKEHWRQLFVDHSGCQNGRFGSILFDREAAVGFIGATFSERTFGGETHSICNMSNWIVKNEYRSHSLGLLSKVVASKAAAITNITRTPLVLRVCPGDRLQERRLHVGGQLRHAAPVGPVFPAVGVHGGPFWTAGSRGKPCPAGPESRAGRCAFPADR